jgi:hypothetical protein
VAYVHADRALCVELIGTPVEFDDASDAAAMVSRVLVSDYPVYATIRLPHRSNGLGEWWRRTAAYTSSRTRTPRWSRSEAPTSTSQPATC